MNPTEDLKAVFHKAIEAVDPYALMTQSIRREQNVLVIECEGKRLVEDLSRYKTILVLGVGKASARMARAMEEILGETLFHGVVVTKYGNTEGLNKIRVLEAGHPIPDENSIEGARVLAALASDADSTTLIFNLISGGGSALLTLPRDGISLKDKQATTKILLESGAAITEINCIRKHISNIKGGNFAKMAYPARMISLILSDVVGDRLETIASGMTAPDPTTYSQAHDILTKYHIVDKVPATVKRTIESGMKGLIPETPKISDPAFENIENILIGNNLLACRAAKAYGEKLGYNAKILTTTLTGEARETARYFSSLARDIDSGRSDFARPALLIAGGETTVTIHHSGKGGRNQEMALAFACDLIESHPEFTNIFFLSAGSDGIDGPTDAAGAFVNHDLKEKVDKLRLKPHKYLENHDSYAFFEATGHLFMTGPTNTNVCDIQLLIVT